MEISLKFILLGDSCVGKTQILNHYIEKKYIKITSGTFGLDYEKTIIEINEKKIHLIICFFSKYFIDNCIKIFSILL